MPLFVFLVCKMGMCDCVARLLRIIRIEKLLRWYKNIKARKGADDLKH